MAQDEIEKFLNKNKGKKFTARQIQIAIDINMSAFSNLKKIRNDDESPICYEVYEDPVSGRMTRRYWIPKQ